MGETTRRLILTKPSASGADGYTFEVPELRTSPLRRVSNLGLLVLAECRTLMLMEEKSNAIDYFSLHHPLRPLVSRVSNSARKKMFGTFMRLMDPQPSDKILDVGVTPDETLQESNFFEQLYPHREMITATSIEDAKFLESRYPGISFVQTDGASLPFDDKSFDIVCSFAVLEHVGTREQQRRFIAEAMRVGKKLFLTTPDKAFPVEVHTFIPLLHYLPQHLHQRALAMLGLKFWAQTENLNLVFEHDLRCLFPQNANVQIYKNRTLGLSSNLLAIATQS